MCSSVLTDPDIAPWLLLCSLVTTKQRMNGL
jgi:hypothetical protein